MYLTIPPYGIPYIDQQGMANLARTPQMQQPRLHPSVEAIPGTLDLRLGYRLYGSSGPFDITFPIAYRSIKLQHSHNTTRDRRPTNVMAVAFHSLLRRTEFTEGTQLGHWHWHGQTRNGGVPFMGFFNENRHPVEVVVACACYGRFKTLYKIRLCGNKRCINPRHWMLESPDFNMPTSYLDCFKQNLTKEPGWHEIQYEHLDKRLPTFRRPDIEPWGRLRPDAEFFGFSDEQYKILEESTAAFRKLNLPVKDEDSLAKPEELEVDLDLDRSTGGIDYTDKDLVP